MSLSMDESARYVTQSSVYSCPMKGPLTDRAIARYQKQGYYGNGGILFERKEKAKKKQPRRVNALAALVKSLGLYE